MKLRPIALALVLSCGVSTTELAWADKAAPAAQPGGEKAARKADRAHDLSLLGAFLLNPFAALLQAGRVSSSRHASHGAPKHTTSTDKTPTGSQQTRR